MSEGVDPTNLEIKLDPAELYLEEIFTDRRVGTLRRLTPVTREGSPDTSRAVMFVGQAQLWTQLGPIPVTFEIEAPTLEDALEAYPQAARKAIEQTMEEAKELRRQQASQIVVPEVGTGGKIQLP